jgi:hypothetical protein
LAATASAVGAQPSGALARLALDGAWPGVRVNDEIE